MAYQQNPSIIGLPAQTLANLSQNPLQGLMAGYQFGNALYEQQQQRGLQQDLAQAFDPQTGQVDTAKVLRALMQRDPATGIKFMQQKRLEDQQQAALQWLAGEQTATPTGTGGGTPPGAGLAGISPEARKQLLIGGLLKGDIGGAAMKLGELQQNAYLQDYARGQEMINVTDPQTGAVYQVPRGQAMPGPSAQPIPSGQPAPSAQGIPSGQPAPPVRSIPSGQPPAVAGTPGGSVSIPADTNGNQFQITLDTWRGMDQPSRLALLKKMTPGQRTLFQQQLYGPPGSEGTMAPSIPATPPVVSGPQGIPKTPPAQLPPPLTQNAYGPGIPTASSPPGLLVKRPPAQEQVEQETIKQQYQIAAEQRAEQQRIAKEQREAALAAQQAYPIEKSKEEAKADSALSKDWNTQAAAATSGLTFVKGLTDLINKGAFDQGALASWYGKYGKILYAVGAPIDSGAIQQNIKNEQATSLINQTVLSLLGGKLGAQVSDSDRKFITEMLPQIGSNPEAARQIMDRLGQNFALVRDKWTGWLKASRANPSLRESDYENNWQQELTNRWGGGAPSASPGTAAPAGQPAAPGASQPGAYSLRFPNGNTLSREQLMAMPEAARRLIVERVKSGEIQKIGAP